MSLNQLLNNPNTPCLPWKRVKVYDLDACQTVTAPEGNFDNIDVTTINGSPYPPANPPLPLPLIANKVLRTNNTATSVLWGDVPHGAADSVLQTNAAGNGIEWRLNAKIPGTLEVVGNSTLASANVQGNLQFNGVSGNIGDVLTKTGANTQSFQPGFSIPNGAANQVYVMNGAGTAQLFSNNINLPGNLTVNGNSTVLNMIVNGSTTLVNAATVNGDLQFNGSSGAIGAVITKTALNDQDWVLPSQIANIRYVTAFTNQNLNAAAGPTALSFNTSPISNIASASRGSVTGISQPSATQFSVGFTGTYDIPITGYIDPASTGTVSSVVALTVEVNGVELTNSCIVVNTLSFSGQFSGIPITAGNIVRILSRRITGTGTFNTFAAPATAPNFASTISFGLVSTVN